jgi:hypothetical protein
MVIEDCLRAFKRFKDFFRIVHVATATSRPKHFNKPTLISNDPPAVTNVPPSDHERTLFGFIRGQSYFSHAGREDQSPIEPRPLSSSGHLSATFKCHPIPFLSRATGGVNGNRDLRPNIFRADKLAPDNVVALRRRALGSRILPPSVIGGPGGCLGFTR